MANKIFTVYDGTKYMNIQAEPILKNNKETGHYKEVGREYITINGIIDNEEMKQKIIDSINELHGMYNSNYYILEERKPIQENYLFSSYSMTPQYSSIGEAIINHIQKNNWIVLSYENVLLEKRNGQEVETIHFIYDIENKNNYEKNVHAYFYYIEATAFDF